MAEFSAPWLNDGEPINVKPLPFRGVQQVGELARESSELSADYGNILRLYTYGSMLGCLKMLQKSGVGPAKEAWDQNVQELAISEEAQDEVNWPEEEFEENFTDMVEDRVKSNLDPTTDDPSVEDYIDAVGEEIEGLLEERSLSDIRAEMQELEMEKICTEFYWRHKNDDVEITARNEAGAFSIQNLKNVMTFEDWSNYRAALSKTDMKKAQTPNEEIDQMMEPESREELKKSSTRA